MMLDETSAVNDLTVAFATRHDRPGFFVIRTHRCYSLDYVSLLEDHFDSLCTHKRVGVVGEVEVHSIRSLLDA